MIDKVADANVTKTSENKSLIKDESVSNNQSVSNDDVDKFELELESTTDDKISENDSKNEENSDDKSDNKEEPQFAIDLNQQKFTNDKVKKHEQITTDGNNIRDNNDKNTEKKSSRPLKIDTNTNTKDIHIAENVKKDANQRALKIDANEQKLKNDATPGYNITKNDSTPGGIILSNVNKSTASSSEKMILISTILDKINSAEGIGKNREISIQIEKGYFNGLDIDIKVDKGTIYLSFSGSSLQLESIQMLVPELSDRLNKLNNEQEVKFVLNNVSDDQTDQYSNDDSDGRESKHQDDIDEWLEEQRGD